MNISSMNEPLSPTQIVPAGHLVSQIFKGSEWIGKQKYTFISTALGCVGLLSLGLAVSAYVSQQKEIEVPTWLMSAGMGLFGIISLSGSYAVRYFVSESSNSGQQLQQMVTWLRDSHERVSAIHQTVTIHREALVNIVQQNRSLNDDLTEIVIVAQNNGARMQRALNENDYKEETTARYANAEQVIKEARKVREKLKKNTN